MRPPSLRMKPPLRLRAAAALAALALVLAAPALAQRLSDRTIFIVVPFTPGTGPDIVARFVARSCASARPAGRGREHPRRQGQYRHASRCGARRARRPHPDVVGQHAGHERQPVQEPALRPGDRLRADRRGRTGARWCWPRIPSVAAKSLRGADHRRQGATRQAHLRQPGRGTPHHLSMALVEQTAQASSCCMCPTRARPAPCRTSRRPDRLHVPAGPRLARPVHPRRQAEGDRRRQPGACRSCPTCRPCRGGHGRRRRRHVVRPVRARRPRRAQIVERSIAGGRDPGNAAPRTAFEAQGMRADHLDARRACARSCVRDRKRWAEVVPGRGITAE